MRSGYDIIVIGGGHAGVEAAWVASNLGADVGMVTMSAEAIARMSCNPAIGGLGKGQIVREIDALGGIMGLAIDRAGIQFRMLNLSKGPAVWAPRAQADREGYSLAVREILRDARSIELIEGIVECIDTREHNDASRSDAAKIGHSARAEARGSLGGEDRTGAETTPTKRVTGVTLTDGRRILAQCVIVTSGTFMRAIMHTGSDQSEGGRVGERSAAGLSPSLAALGLTLGRLKTGTPPRVHRDTIDYAACEVQPGDDVPTPFSFMTDRIAQPQIDCWITWTSPRAHEHIRANLHRAPMYTGQIESTGPRYCPSIEDKVVRFADKERHQIFLEPEGYDNERVYCNGISTSLPTDVQDVIVGTTPGLERARILQYGYAVEYDFVPTSQTKASLESKAAAGLFLAGQINGTSGYEEAAGQGLIAGINAVRFLKEAEPVVLGRDQAYIGVMIDDLVTRPPTEPYRMFTSRAEYRLILRADNADLRLTPLGRELGTVDDHRFAAYQRKREAMAAITELCSQASRAGVDLPKWMRRPEADLDGLADALAPLSTDIFSSAHLWQVLIEAKYSGYVDRQSRQIERFKRLESMMIPDSVDYSAMPQLRFEARERLTTIAPRTLGQAARISGVNPADITVLWVYLSGRRSPGRVG